MSLNHLQDCGDEWARSHKEREAMEEHDAAHWKDPTFYWGECSICADKIEADIEAGTRCQKHGEQACDKCEVAMQMAIDKSIENEINASEEDQRYEKWKKQKDYEEAQNAH